MKLRDSSIKMLPAILFMNVNERKAKVAEFDAMKEQFDLIMANMQNHVRQYLCALHTYIM
jgi:hypothetical protein